jgi:DNA-binding transcriptional ArsR family regulator
MKCPSYNLFFETISNKTRMEILFLLKEKPMSVTEICNSLGQEQSKISHNLKKLVDCNIIEAEQRGKQRIYSLNKETIIPILELVEKHVKKCCKGACPKIK